MAKKKVEHSDWDLEQQFDLSATLEELIGEPPFREVSGENADSKTVAARVPQWLHRRAKKLKEVDGSPYEVDSDVYRDAIYIGMKVLNMRYRVNPDWDVESKMANIVDSAGMAHRLKRQVKELVDSLNDLWKDNDEVHAADMLKNYINAATELESVWYKRRLFALLREDSTIQTVLSKCDKSVGETVRREAK
jgi:molybdopterin converting factor small subunit